MSITDATTSLDTAWTEASTVTFASGVLDTMAACVTEVESKIKRGTLSASTDPTLTQVQNWLKRAKMELAEAKGFTFNRKYAAVSLTADTYRYSMPPDYNGGAIALRDMTNDRHITIWPENWYNKKFPDPSEETSGEVMVACVKNMELWVVPPPDGADSLELEYDRSGAETTSDDFTWLPEIERFRCCDYAISEAFLSIHMWEQAQLYTQRWISALGKAIRADGKRKWQGKRYQAINVFQEFNAKNYQP
jgi:hypothetical protein